MSRSFIDFGRHTAVDPLEKLWKDLSRDIFARTPNWSPGYTTPPERRKRVRYKPDEPGRNRGSWLQRAGRL